MDEIKSELQEDLAELEHEQWAHWTNYMLKKLEEDAGEEGLPLGCVPVILHWKKQCETHYSNLSEKEKDSDRKWAERVMERIIPFVEAKKIPFTKEQDQLQRLYSRLTGELIEGDYIGTARGEVNICLNVLFLNKAIIQILEKEHPNIAKEIRDKAYKQRAEAFGRLYY